MALNFFKTLSFQSHRIIFTNQLRKFCNSNIIMANNKSLLSNTHLSRAKIDAQVKHLFDESSPLNVYNKTIINLAAGCPGPDLLEPVANIINQATKHRMDLEKANDYCLFQYGPTVGLWGMREILSKFLTEQYGDEVKREDLALTCGATHGLHLLLSTMLVPNGVIFVEEYTYMIALNVFKEFPNFKIIPIPITPEGVDIKELARIVESVKTKSEFNVTADKPFWAMFYTIPTFHNPTGILLSNDKCKALVKTARDLDFLIVCDDVYNLLHYDDNPYPPPRLFSYDKQNDSDFRGGHVVSNCTFSKILAPGIRVGWMEVPTRVSSRLRESGILQSGGSVNNVMYGIVQSILELDLLANHVKSVRSIYKDRMATMCTVLNKCLPKGCKFLRPQGGYFIWLEVPVNAEKFLAWCQENGGPGAIPDVRFQLNSSSSIYDMDYNTINGNDNRRAIRLSIAFHDIDTIAASATDLANKLNLYMSTVDKK